MAVDWQALRDEVGEAIKSVAETDEGFPVTLRSEGENTGTEYNPVFGGPTYVTLHCIDANKTLFDRNGTLIKQDQRTLTVTAVEGIEPLPSQKIAIGITADLADEDSDWQEIDDVRPLAPAGIAVLYKIDLVS